MLHRDQWRCGLRLSAPEVLSLSNARHRAQADLDVEFDKRLRAVLLVGSQRLTQLEAARVFEVTENCVTRWVMAYERRGVEGLRPRQRPGPRPRLAPEQLRRLTALIDRGPERCGYDTGTWTGALVRELIRKNFGVVESVRQVRRLLHREGYSVQYPKKVLSEASLFEKRKWLLKHYPAIKKQAEREHGAILFEDECVFQQEGGLRRTWARVGVGVEVKSQPCRRSCKTYGAVRVDKRDPKFHFRFETGRFNTDTFIVFCEQLLHYYAATDRRVHLILDGASYHKKAKTWALPNRKYIEFHFLPGYSPDLNPAEEVWHNTKAVATHNRYFPTLNVLRKAILRRFNRYQGNPNALRGVVRRYT